MKVDGSVKSLLQGVSQQPPRDRLPGQCTLQVNQRADPIDGNARRQPTDLVGTLGASSGVRAWHEFKVKDQTDFVAGFHEDGHITVHDLNATSHTVTVVSGTASYLTTAGLLRFYTDEDNDRTFVVNTSFIPQMLTSVKSFGNFGVGVPTVGIIQVLGGAYARNYVINVDGVQKALYLPPNGTTATDINKVQTSNIAERLRQALTGSAGTTAPDGATSSLVTSGFMAASPWIVQRFEDVLLIANTNSVVFTLSVSDDAGNVNMKAMTTQVKSIADLPRICIKNYAVRIATNVDPLDDVWYQFLTEDATVTAGQGFGKPGYWAECVAPGTTYKLDPATMPHVLTFNEGPGTFTFDVATWGERTVGTTKSNSEPSYVGLPINDVFSTQSRLGFLAGKNLILSVTNDYTNFWFTSQQAKSAVDPIDISSTSEKGANLAAAIEHDKTLVVFSKGGAQFTLSGNNGDNASLDLATGFEADLTASPASAGKNIFFATQFGAFTGIREFFTQITNTANDARPITDHIKKYINGHATKLVTSPNHGVMFVLTDASATTVYPYQYIWADDQKVQSAWSQWVFHDNISYMFFVNDRVYIILSIAGSFYLLRLALDIVAEDAIGFPIFLDSRFDVDSMHTQFTLPFAWMHTKDLVVVQGEGCPNPGFDVPITSIALVGGNWIVTIKTDMLGGNILVGIKFRSAYRPTMPLVKDQDGVDVATGHLRVREFLVSVLQTGYILGQQIAKWGNGPLIAFNGRIVGNIDNVVGEVHLSDTIFHMPFRTDTDMAEVEFSSDSHLPMAMTDIDFVGQYQKRGRRISTGG